MKRTLSIALWLGLCACTHARDKTYADKACVQDQVVLLTAHRACKEVP